MNDYQKRQARCNCLTAFRRGFIEAAMDFAAEFPDGAFMAYMEEQGIDVSELEAFSLEHDCKKQKVKI
jgi:hypothetical protein